MHGQFMKKGMAVFLTAMMLFSLVTPATGAYAAPDEKDAMTKAPTIGQTLTMPAGDPPFPDKIVKGVSPLGTTIDLFDYWITGQLDQDDWEDKGKVDEALLMQGINEDHALVFSKSCNEIRTDPWNQWTGDIRPYPDIVQRTLGTDGFPRLNHLQLQPNSEVYGTDAAESLAYLFDTTMSVDGKAGYANVKDLLQVDDEGYFYYDSGKNFATYYEDKNAFTLYKYPGVVSNGTGEKRIVGQFFPFNEPTVDAKEVNHEEKIYTLMHDGLSRTDTTLNHFLGAHMTTHFIQKYNGYDAEKNGKPVSYEFSGDDDVWVFIDGVLVADLGGIHDKTNLKIEFNTGKVSINNPGEHGHVSTTLKEQFAKAGKADAVSWNGNTFANDSTHTLDFFYLERGNGDANMSLKFNLMYIPESSLIKVDQVGQTVSGATFELRLPNGRSIATGTTDRNGQFVFRKRDGNLMTLQEIYTRFGPSGTGDINATDEETDLHLVETKIPSGYRDTGDVELRFYQTPKGRLMLLSNNLWDTGAYTMPNVTTVVDRTVSLFDVNSGVQGQQPVGEVTLDPAQDPLMFAVVFQKQADGTWRPVYGDPLKGWQVTPGNAWQDVITAAKANPYRFALSTSGGYTTTVENLPGDIRSYYYLSNDPKYTVQYYYSEAASIDAVNGSNTWLIGETDAHPINRMFSADIYVPDVKNYLFVKKVDEKQQPLAGATFALYKKEDITVKEDGTYTIRDGARTYDTVTTTLDGWTSEEFEGAARFPSANSKLDEGQYYLIEQQAPAGYDINPQATKVIVGPDGVYADAGTADDAISVLRGVGSILKSMVQFAVDDPVDVTLHDIKTTLQTGKLDTDGNLQWAEEKDVWSDAANVQHLQYKTNNPLLEYGPQEPGTIVGEKIDEGWGRLSVRQCQEHTGTLKGTKLDLGDQSLTNLFSGICMVQVVNTPKDPQPPTKGDLVVSKTVAGAEGDQQRDWHFEVTLNQALDGTYGDMTFEKGVATFTLKHGESKKATGLPAGITYTVTEKEANQEDYTTTVTGNVGFIEVGKRVTAAFTNTKQDKGDLVVSKTVVGNAGDNTRDWRFMVVLKDSNNQAFTGDIAYTHSNGTTGYLMSGESFNLKHGETLTLHDLPVGTSYKVTEVDANKDGYTTTATGEKGTIEKGKAVTAAFTNTKETVTPPPVEDKGDLVVSKTVAGAEGDQQREWHFVVTLDQALDGTYGDMAFKDGVATVALKHGESKKAADLPAGITYTVTETEANQDGYTTTATGVNGTIEKEKDATAAFTNTKKPVTPPSGNDKGSLVIGKTVAGAEGDQQREWHFVVTLNQALNGTYGDMTFKDGVATVALKHDESKKAADLPAGITYTVTETEANQDGYTTTATGVNGTIEKEKDATAAFTNTKKTVTPPPSGNDKGSLVIGKTVAGNAGDTTKAWTFSVALTDDKGTVLSGKYPYSHSNGTKGTLAGGDTFVLKHGEKLTLKDLPVGTSYKVTEVDANKDGYTTTVVDGEGSIVANQSATATFVNTKHSTPPPSGNDKGSLVIGKTVAGNAGDTTKAWTFSVALTDDKGAVLTGKYPYSHSNGTKGTLASGDTVALKHGEKLTLKDLPVGTSYKVTEVDANKDGYTTTIVNGEGSIVANQSATATFVNTKHSTPPTPPPVKPDKGSGVLVISKTVDGDQGDQTKPWTFTVTFKDSKGQSLKGSYAYTHSNGATGRLSSGDKVALKHGETLKIHGLPSGTRYTVAEAEANKDGYTTVSVDEKGVISKDKTLTAAFTNTKRSVTPPPSSGDTGALVIEKTVSGNKGDKDRAWTFTVTLKDSQGQVLKGNYAYKRSDGTTGTLASGDAFSLKHGQTLTLQGLPVGVSYAVTEAEANKDGYTTKMSGNQGTIAKNKTAKAHFTNTKEGTAGSTTPSKPSTNTPQTGDPRVTWLWGLLCLASLSGLLILLKGKRFSNK